MDEAEWLKSNDAQALYAFVERRMTPTQRRCFTLACGRRHCRLWEAGRYDSDEEEAHWLPRKPHIDDLCRRMLDAAESLVDAMGPAASEVEVIQKALAELAPFRLRRDLWAVVTGQARLPLRGLRPDGLLRGLEPGRYALQEGLRSHEEQAEGLRWCPRQTRRASASSPG
jgi:hypothetical protein